MVSEQLSGSNFVRGGASGELGAPVFCYLMAEEDISFILFLLFIPSLLLFSSFRNVVMNSWEKMTYFYTSMSHHKGNANDA